MANGGIFKVIRGIPPTFHDNRFQQAGMGRREGREVQDVSVDPHETFLWCVVPGEDVIDEGILMVSM